MEKRKLLIGLIALSVICIVLTSGCVNEKRTTPSPSSTPALTPTTPAPSVTPASTTTTSTSASGGLQSCTELNGFECGMGEDCPGEWLDASDTFSCCSEPCTSSIGAEGILTIEPFEPNPENEELGEVT